MALTDSQKKWLALMPKVTGFLSLFCSAIVIYAIVRCPAKRKRIYHRLLLGISLFDICNSIAFGISTWPIPSSSGFMWAIGNDLSCTMQGFFIQLGTSASFFNGCLSVYYVLILRYDWRESQIEKYQPILYGAPIIWGAGTAIMGLALRLYNNANLWCWIAQYPAGCEGDTCIRGAGATTFRWAFYYAPLWTMILLVTFSQISVFLHVRQSLIVNTTNKKSKIKSRDSVSQSNKISDHTHDETSGPFATRDEQKMADFVKKTAKKAQLNENNRKKKREIMTQCFLYAGSFYFNWCALTAVRAMQAAKVNVGFPLLLLAAAITPLQGLPNLLIYIYPNYLDEKRLDPGGGARKWFMNALHK